MKTSAETTLENKIYTISKSGQIQLNYPYYEVKLNPTKNGKFTLWATISDYTFEEFIDLVWQKVVSDLPITKSEQFVKKHTYVAGDKYRDNFDIEGMILAVSNLEMPEVKFYIDIFEAHLESLEDLNYHTLVEYGCDYLTILEETPDKKVLLKYFWNKFIKEAKLNAIDNGFVKTNKIKVASITK